MRANSFIAVEGRLSTLNCQCPAGYWGIVAVSNYSTAVQSVGLSLVAKIQLPTEYSVGSYRLLLVWIKIIKNRMI